MNNGASTFRNLYVGYQGGAYSRAGTAFVGFSKQTGRSYPPRLINFQFSINQGLALEFGHQYMRVISNGAYVTTNSLLITGATQANPCVVTAPATGSTGATPVNSSVTASYAPGDTITLAGGTFTVPTQLGVTGTQLIGLTLNAPGAGFAPNDTLHLVGGTQTSSAILTVGTTQVVNAAVVNAGTGGTPGIATVTGTTGTGTKFQALVTIGSGGSISSVNLILVPGSYTVNPSVPTAEPVTGGGLTGATLNLTIGILNFSISTVGVFTANPTGGAFTQGATSGSGSGATFQSALMAPNALSVITPGSYSAYPPNPVSQGSTSGTGFGGLFNVSQASATPFQNGDWVFIANVNGMTQLNGQTYVVHGVSGSTFQLYDVYGNAVDATGFSPYLSGGTASLIYTLSTPWAEQDLPYLKWTQSADVMSICCVNQATGTEYQPYDLGRVTDTNWTLNAVSPAPTILPPSSISGVAGFSGSGSQNVFYSYVVTAVSGSDGTESVASSILSLLNVDIAAQLGTNQINWSPVAGASDYNVYRASPAYGYPTPTGALYGFVGSATGTQFLDGNVTADLTQVPPDYNNPFARGQILSAIPTAGGGGYSNITFTINTSTGSGAVLVPVIQNGVLQSILVEQGGKNYAATDTVTVNGNGSGATAKLTIGPQSGTYPSTVAYFQERRVYGNSLNNPDTYWMSQPGSFTNFDIRTPTIASDAIIGSPWSVEVNGIQWMVNMPGGLVVLTGVSAWQLTGAGGSSLNPQPITPSTQQAQPQAYNGCSATVPPIRIDFDIIYLQAKGTKYRDLSYNFYVNIYTGADITENSSHLFNGVTIKEHAWCEEPNYILWSVRSDGVLLSLTYLKPQQVAGWARHDTQGFFQSVCSVTEPPVDALYCAVQRQLGSNVAYTIERMDNRLWPTTEDCWCVDCGLSLGQPTPNATLTASSATGLGSITGVTNLVGGQNYGPATTATVVDNDGQGPGTGAIPSLTIVGGVITAITFTGGNQGSGYVQPAITISDPSGQGSGASARPVLNNAATFTASAAVFTNGSVGNVIRMGGGVAVITAFTDSEHVTANITNPITLVSANGVPQQAPAGAWTLSAPVTTISGLNHLIGATVTGLADGNIIPPTVVSAQGTITLATPASSVTVGLGFTAQLQSLYLDASQPTIQAQRKKISAVSVRAQSSRDLMVGANQPDGSTLNPPQIAPAWNRLTAVPNASPNDQLAKKKPYNSAFTPLYTSDRRIELEGGFQKFGQIALQQSNPVPMEILALIPELWPGDLTETIAQPEKGLAARNAGRGVRPGSGARAQ